jgi:hypothetical protein
MLSITTTKEKHTRVPIPSDWVANLGSSGSFTKAEFESMVPKNANGNFELTVPEIYFTAGDTDVQKVMVGLPIETTGQVLIKEGGADGHKVRILRHLVECCIADAKPFIVAVDAQDLAAFKEHTWVRVTGTIKYLHRDSQSMAVMEVQTVQEIGEPANKFIQ